MTLKIKNITASYGKEPILDDISFSVNTKEFTALLGLNGTGKTTLLKVICGLLKSQDGQCFIDDINIRELSDKKRARHISFMSQRNSVVYDTKVIDVVLMGITPYLGAFDTPTKVHREMAYNILKKIEIEKLADENFLHLSEGQKQLIIIARSLMQDSEVMLFDEPDSALDFNNSHMVLSKISEVVRKENKAGLITLHDPNMALNYCDRIIILKDKKIFADFYTNDVRQEFLEDTFNMIYAGIEIIEHKGKYIIIKKVSF
ncbi:ABC transporter ATP-binding protein [Tissierella sp. Yu-01]|uniref:ABC transporter ATP-binding protein n=1 Tax=Tissierella sp. Yu-01 TaxID=3035694 RepID=UPI00240D355A|nr:ABC transporter ATP-binding protein [Tissierella sp. Yu-01]WFA10010.1 ABC transporter ATP-binding protein [Tissierella sp. Yu-01]